MDLFVPLLQRQQAQSLARQLEADAKAQRAADFNAAELGADKPTQAAVPEVAVAKAPTPKPPPKPTSKPTSKPAVAPAPAVRTGGKWQVQLGAFGVAANADRLWSKLSGNPVLVGTKKTLVASGKVTRLLATGYASQADANRACARLKQQGHSCLVVGHN